MLMIFICSLLVVFILSLRIPADAVAEGGLPAENARADTHKHGNELALARKSTVAAMSSPEGPQPEWYKNFRVELEGRALTYCKLVEYLSGGTSSLGLGRAETEEK